MKALIVTVAGTSTRFGESIGKPCLKCIYNRNGIQESLLYKMLHRDKSFDKLVIVGGYKFDELENAVKNYFADISDKIVLLYNDKFVEYGSGYSLYFGLKYVVENGYDEVVFAEGDLFVDDKSFDAVSAANADVVTYTKEPIESRRSVAFYYDVNDRAHYLYDTTHNTLEIREPFLSVYDSGQVWKFNNGKRIKDTFYDLTANDWHGTNLVFIQRYFGGMRKDDYRLIRFETWINCNTVHDFDKTKE